MGKYRTNLIAVFVHKRLGGNDALSEHTKMCLGECEKALLVATRNFPSDKIDPKRIFLQCTSEMSTLEFARLIVKLSAQNGFDNILVVSDKKHVSRLERDIRKCAPKHDTTAAGKYSQKNFLECYKVYSSAASENIKRNFSTIKSWISWWLIEIPKRLLPWRLYSVLAS